MMARWERSVPVYDVPIWTRALYVLGVVGAIALGFTLWREFAGLGPTTGLNDAYAWGIWKTFNVMVLTGLGSGGFSIGIAAWLFRRERLHSVMRTALLTSFLAYLSGLTLLAVDVGRPWNMYWLLMPWKWNFHSPLLEVAFCMPMYALFPLLLENVPPVLEWVHEKRPQYRELVEKAEKIMLRFYPFVVGLAYVLPAMHQSSLGALMLLAGNRVNTLWQTPMLPLFYVWAAAFMGFSCVAGTLLFCTLVWRRKLDVEVLSEMNRITAWLVGTWLIARFVDLIARGKFTAALSLDVFAGLFWMETLFLGVALFMLIDSARHQDAKLMFYAHTVCAVGGMLYRFDPTTLAFQPRPGAFYFPSVVELLISVGFVSLAVIGFAYAVKVLAILPGTNKDWYDMLKYRAENDGDRDSATVGTPGFATGSSFTD
jgi:Ni/Fe-hydrogenase subunit HybB-like protein